MCRCMYKCIYSKTIGSLLHKLISLSNLVSCVQLADFIIAAIILEICHSSLLKNYVVYFQNMLQHTQVLSGAITELWSVSVNGEIMTPKKKGNITCSMYFGAPGFLGSLSSMWFD